MSNTCEWSLMVHRAGDGPQSTPDVTEGELFDFGRDHAVQLLKESMRGHDEHVDGWMRHVVDERGSEGLFAVAVCLIVGGSSGQVSSFQIINVKSGRASGMGVDDAPPFVRVMARLPVAVTNFDIETAWALWQAMPESDQVSAVSMFLAVATAHFGRTE